MRESLQVPGDSIKKSASASSLRGAKGDDDTKIDGQPGTVSNGDRLDEEGRRKRGAVGTVKKIITLEKTVPEKRLKFPFPKDSPKRGCCLSQPSVTFTRRI